MKIGGFDVAHGDKVTYRNAAGKSRTGTVNGLLVFPTHLVLDAGGPHGTPVVVMPEQILSVKKKDVKDLPSPL